MNKIKIEGVEYTLLPIPFLDKVGQAVVDAYNFKDQTVVVKCFDIMTEVYKRGSHKIKNKDNVEYNALALTKQEIQFLKTKYDSLDHSII